MMALKGCTFCAIYYRGLDLQRRNIYTISLVQSEVQEPKDRQNMECWEGDASKTLDNKWLCDFSSDQFTTS
jgi:hypothetical protein